jgi:putative alpha-1,2-mannosidase
VTIQLENGKEIEIKADGNSKENRYIAEVLLNGKTHTRNYLTHDELMKEAKINFKMSRVPNKSRGINKSDFPYSFSNEK